MTIVRTIDAHAGGQPLRLVIDGYPAPRGRMLLDKREWARKHADRIRRALVLEPRGHADMCAAVLTEPALPASHAGVLFMDARGYPAMSGHGVIAVASIARAYRLVVPAGDGGEVVFDTPAGTVRTTPAGFLNVPSFVLQAGLPIRIGARAIRADVAFAGVFYAIVDSESAGLGVDGRQAGELRRMGIEIVRAVNATQSIVHPLEPRLAGVDAVIFTAPASGGAADLRSVTVSADGAVDRSPGGTATAAIMTVLSAMGFLDDRTSFVHESIIGAEFTGRIEGRTRVADCEAIVAAIDGSAWTTGEHSFVIEDDDPFGGGFLL